MISSLPLAQPIKDKTAGLLDNEPYPHRTTNPQLNGQNDKPTLAEGRLEITDYTSTINSGEPGAHETSNGLLKLVDDGFGVEFEGTEVCGEDNLKLSSVLHSELSDSRNSSIDMEYGDDSEDLATTILKLRCGRYHFVLPCIQALSKNLLVKPFSLFNFLQSSNFNSIH